MTKNSFIKEQNHNITHEKKVPKLQLRIMQVDGVAEPIQDESSGLHPSERRMFNKKGSTNDRNTFGGGNGPHAKPKRGEENNLTPISFADGLILNQSQKSMQRQSEQ